MSIRTAAIALCAAVFLSGCAAQNTIRTNSDSSVDLKSYKTFGYFQPLGTDKSGYGSLISQQLKTSSRRQMEKLGYVYSEESPDLLLNFNGRLDNKLRVDQVPTATVGVGYYGYRGGMYGAWPAYSTEVSEYAEGTLNVDLVDRARRQLVWEGVAVRRVTEKDRRNVGTVLDMVVTDLFKEFPTAKDANQK